MDFPILSSLILLPLIGALFIIFINSKNSIYQSSKYVALFISLANLILSLYLWYIFDNQQADFQFVGAYICQQINQTAIFSQQISQQVIVRSSFLTKASLVMAL